MEKYDYDINADAFVLRKTDFDYAYSIDVTSEIIIDVDSNKNIIGIEVLDASKVLNVEPELLIHPKKLSAKVVSTDEGIMLTMTFECDNITRKFDITISNFISSGAALVVDA